MKLMNRMFITSAAMLALVTVSATTATYAWWTNILESKASVNTVTAASDGKLNITYAPVIGLTQSDALTGEFTNNGNALTDVSTEDGSTFYKAAMKPDGITVDKINKITTLSNTYANNTYYVYQFTATIKMTGTAGRTYYVYLGDGKNDEQMIVPDANMATESGSNEHSARVSVVGTAKSTTSGTQATTDIAKIYAQSGAKETTTSGETTTTVLACDVNNDTPNVLENVSIPYQILDGKITEETAVTTTNTTMDKNCLGFIAADNDVIELTFTMYFEGADTNGAVTSYDSFKTNFYFYALMKK